MLKFLKREIKQTLQTLYKLTENTREQKFVKYVSNSIKKGDIVDFAEEIGGGLIIRLSNGYSYDMHPYGIRKSSEPKWKNQSNYDEQQNV